MQMGGGITNNYKTFIINYNNDTSAWSMPDITVSVDSSNIDDKFTTIITNQNELAADYFLFYTLPSGPYIQVSKDKIMMNNSQHLNLPVGSILMYHKSVSYDSAWLFCDGKEYAVANYPELASVLNKKYGSTSNAYFNEPNLVDRFPIGANGPGDTTIEEDTLDTSGNRLGGSWNIKSKQFIHTHTFPPPTPKQYISNFSLAYFLDNGYNFWGSNDDTTSANKPSEKYSNYSIDTDPIPSTIHKPQYFVVKYVIFTGKGII